MTNQTYYIDFNGGNDANDGLSFANRKKSFNNLISENDNSSNQSAHGDEYRVMGMPAVDTGVNATWTKGGYQMRDANNNSIPQKTIQGATAAAPIEITINNHGYSTGDIIWIYNVSGIFSANGSWIITVTGTNTFTLNNSDGTGHYDTGSFSSSEAPRAYQINHKGIKVNTQCKRIAFCSGSTQTNDNDHNYANSLYPVSSTDITTNNRGWAHNIRNIRTQIGNNFTTGKAWYYKLPEELDLSAYQGISFTIHNTNDTDGGRANKELRLCSDETGDTAVNTIQIRAFISRGNMTMVTDTGGNLGSSIKSIALYINTDRGAEDIRITNIIAYKTGVNDVVTHDDVFGKNTTAEPVYWKPWYIQEDHILFSFNNMDLNHDVNDVTNGSTATSYAGTSETVSLYKITPFNLYGSNNITNDVQTSWYYRYLVRLRIDSRKRPNQELTKITGGWNTTDMSTQDSVTWMNLFTDNHRWMDLNAVSNNPYTANVLVERFGQGCGQGLLLMEGHKNLTAKNIYQAGFSDNAPIQFSSMTRTRRSIVVDGLYQSNGRYSGVQSNYVTQQSGGDRNTTPVIQKNVHLYATGHQYSTPQTTYIQDLKVLGKQYIFVDAQLNMNSNVTIKNLIADGIYSTLVDADVRVHNPTIGNIQYEIHPHTVNNYGSTNHSLLSLGNYNGTANDHRIYVPNGMIKTETTVRHGTGGVAWKIQPRLEHTGNNAYSAVQNVDHNPLAFTVAKIFVEANKVVTFKAYVRRDSTDITARIAARLDKNIIPINSDVVATCTANADTWQELTLSITPVNSSELLIDFEAFGGNSHTAYIDDISVTQAV